MMETLDKLYLELSKVSKAKTSREKEIVLLLKMLVSAAKIYQTQPSEANKEELNRRLDNADRFLWRYDEEPLY